MIKPLNKLGIGRNFLSLIRGIRDLILDGQAERCAPAPLRPCALRPCAREGRLPLLLLCSSVALEVLAGRVSKKNKGVRGRREVKPSLVIAGRTSWVETPKNCTRALCSNSEFSRVVDVRPARRNPLRVYGSHEPAEKKV